MNMNTPYGTRDVIFEELTQRRKNENKLFELYLERGFLPVETPSIEYFDVFDTAARFISQENMFKMTGLDGKLIVMRPDSTAPIARLVSSKLRDMPKPLKLQFSQRVFRQSDNSKNELLQSGVEIIGGDSGENDLLALFTALESLKRCSDTYEKYKIEIGHSMLFDSLTGKLDLNDDQKKILKKYVSTRNSSGYPFFEDTEALGVARQLISLCGGIDVMDRAYELAKGNAAATEILDSIKKVYLACVDAGYGDNIILDLGMVQGIDYYTGIIFRGYTEKAGCAVLSGGRYDGLYRNFGLDFGACGFAVNLTEL